MRPLARWLLGMFVGVVAFGSAIPPLLARPAALEAPVAYLPVVVNPIPVAVTKWGRTSTRAGWGVLIGEIVTLNSSPIYSVTLDARISDSQDRVLTTTTGLTDFTAALPGQPNPFIMFFPPLTGTDVLHIDIAVTGWRRDHSQTYTPLTIVSRRVCQGAVCEPTPLWPGDVYVRGSVRNDTASTIRDAKVVVWSTESDTTNHAGAELSATVLAPGATAIFTSSALNLNIEPPLERFFGDFRVEAQGEVMP